MNLKGAVAIVTGGSGGLGQRLCHALAKAGSHVAVVYNQSRDLAMAAVHHVQEVGVRAEPFQCDVRDPGQVQNLVSQVLEAFKRVDILINDAGYNKWISFDDLEGLTHDEWNKILDINLTGPMLCIKAAAPAMKRQGKGRIVNISSRAGLGPSGSSIAYAVSKAGLIHLTRCMAVGLAPEILVNCVAPGYIEGTRATANLDPTFQKNAVHGSLLKRAVDGNDIASQVLAFCQTDSITGQTLVIDCGRYFH
jgi:3-oxoacyl-[acyl-carrier protein] reductase